MNLYISTLSKINERTGSKINRMPSDDLYFMRSTIPMAIEMKGEAK
jgi:hypothetical protein